MSINRDPSIFSSNSLIKKFTPVKNPSKIRPFFQKIWHHLKHPFKVHYPDAIKNNLAETIRPVESSPFTVKELWKHYEHYLEGDKNCPPGIKKCFQRLEEDQKNLIKIGQMKTDHTKDEFKKLQAETTFINQTVKQIKHLKIGQSRLLLLSPHESNAELYCTITRKKDGFALSFEGSGEVMHSFQGEEEAFYENGKEKVLRHLTFENISLEALTLF